MSTTIAFDTHAYVKKLRDAGVDELQAEIQADALITLVEDRLATKQDMYALKRDLADIRKDMATIEGNLKRDLADIRKDITTIEGNLKRDIKELDIKAETRFREMDAKAEVTKAEIKRDIKEIDVKAETRIKELDVKAETRIKELELRMVIKMGAMILGGIGLLFGLMRAWPLPVQYVPPPTVQEKHVPAPPTPTQPPVPLSRGQF